MGNHRLTVLYTVNDLRYGGAEQQLLELVKGLDKSRFRPIVAPLYPGGALEQEFRDIPGALVLDINRRGKYDFSILRKISRLLGNNRVDIVQPFLTPATFFGMLPAIVRGTRLKIVSERGSRRSHVSLGFRAYDAAEGLLSRFADVVVANSEAGRQLLLARGVAPARTRVVYNGVNLARLSSPGEAVAEIRKEMSVPEDGRVVGILAALEPEKDHLTFLAAAAQIVRAYPRVTFAVIGNGPMEDALKSTAAALGIASQTRFLGYRKSVGACLSALDVLVSSSYGREGCSNSVLEAMALGTPVVATDAGGNRELVRHGVTGLLVPPRDPQALAAAVNSLFARPEVARELAVRAQQMVHAEFSLAGMVQRYESLYVAGISRAKPSPELAKAHQ